MQNLFVTEYAKFIESRNGYLGSAGQLAGAREHALKSGSPVLA